MKNINTKYILKQNHLYFKENLLPYYNLIHTLDGVIVINVEDSNLKHLLGINKTYNDKYRNMSAKKFYNTLNDRNIDLLDIIDKQHYFDNELTMNELYILRKKYSFIPIFESLFSKPNIRLYKTCIGIVGSSESNYHYFNSVILENNIPEKYKGYPIVVKRVEKVKKDKFIFNAYNFVKSKRFINIQKENKIREKKIDVKAKKKEINKFLNDEIRIEVGRFGKNTIQVFVNDELIEKKLKLDSTYNTSLKIAEYINLYYGNKT